MFVPGQYRAFPTWKNNTARMVIFELLNYLGAFGASQGFGVILGAILYQTGATIPANVNLFLSGAAQGINLSLNSMYPKWLSLDKKRCILQVKEILLEHYNINMPENQIEKELLGFYNSKPTDMIIPLKSLDEEFLVNKLPELSQKLGCSLAQAAYLLVYKESSAKVGAYKFVIEDGNIIGILMAGGVVYFMGPAIALNNMLANTILRSIMAHVSARLTHIITISLADKSSSILSWVIEGFKNNFCVDRKSINLTLGNVQHV